MGYGSLYKFALLDKLGCWGAGCWKIIRGVYTGTPTPPYSYCHIVGSTCRSGHQALSGPKYHTLIITDRIAQYVQLYPNKLDTTLVRSSVAKTNRFNRCV